MSDLTDEDEEAIDILLENSKYRGKLTEWECSFLESLQEQGWMSVKQKEIFERIWKEKTE
jgi:hypothetical protein